ncbi:MAG: hypothetical protein ACYC8T_04345 [Myxococcaceae bacterium]
MNSNPQLGLGLGLTLCSFFSVALAQQPANQLGTVRVEEGHVVLDAEATARVFEPGCVAVAAAAQGQLHVACEDGRVLTFEAGDRWPRLVQERRVEGELRGLFVQGGRVWVEYARVEAQPMGNLPSASATLSTKAAPPAPTTSPPPPLTWPESSSPTTTFAVLEVLGAEIVVSLGGAQGLQGDQTVEIGEQLPGLDGNHTVVGVAREVSAERAVVQVGFGEEVRVGDPVRLSTRGQTGSTAAPPRSGGIISAGVGSRALLPIGRLGVGGLFDAWATWHAETLFALQLRLFPVGGAVADGATGGLFGGSLEALFDSRYFAIGLGLSAEQYQQYQYQSYYQASSSSGFAFGLTQVLRVGAIDGAQFSARNHLAVLGHGFNFAGLEGGVQIPLSTVWWLIVRGGGSVAPLGWGEVGMRIAARGNGGAGTLLITPTLGVAGFTSGNAMAVGPTAGIGFEYRFAPGQRRAGDSHRGIDGK